MSARRGFTLIELMVVIAIIAVLATVGFVSFTNAQISGRDSRRKQDLRALQTAIEAYYTAKGNYPPVGYVGYYNPWPAATGYCDEINDPAAGPNGIQQQPALSLTTGGFINQMPTDPSYGKSNPLTDDYYYWFLQDNGTPRYLLFGVLENKKDPAVVTSVMQHVTIPGSANYNNFDMTTNTSCANRNTDYNYMIVNP